jgi:hypothetical protein
VGLAVEVGALGYLVKHDEEGAGWLRDDLMKVNAVLANNGLPPHVEPETLLVARSRADLMGYPYSFIHYLRRVQAYCLADPGWSFIPAPADWDRHPDAILDAELALMRSHLICHSDAEGHYLPIDFPQPLFDPGRAEGISGGLLGSSQGLMRELVVLAPVLGVTVAAGQLSDGEARRVNGVIGQDGPWERELIAWLSLFEAARLSIAHKTAISFM